MNYEAMSYDFLLARCRALTLSPARAKRKMIDWWGTPIEEKYFEKAFADLRKEGKAVFEHERKTMYSKERFYYIYPE